LELTARVTNTNIIEDLRLVPLPQWWQNPILLVAVALMALVLGWLLYRLSKIQPAPAPAPVEPPGPPPHEEALRRLAELRRQLDTFSPYRLAIEASDVLRGYVHDRYAVPMRFQTSREFLEAARSSPEVTAAQRNELAGFLEFCDLVKFAARGATRKESAGSLDIAERFIRLAAGLK
jgi:hypothetical protein